MYESTPLTEDVHVISHRNGATFDSFAYNIATHDSLYYAYDPQQDFGRRSLSSATDGTLDHTVSLFEDGTAMVGYQLSLVNNQISGVAVTIDTNGQLRALVDGSLQSQMTLAEDPQLEGLVQEGFINRQVANDLLNAFHWGDLIHLACVQRGFPCNQVGTDGASYHVSPHIVEGMDTLILEAGATPRPTLPLLIMPISINR